MEVVIALAILGIGITALMQFYSQSLRTTKRSSDYSTALIHARSYLDEAYSFKEVSLSQESFELKDGFRVKRSVSLLSKVEGIKTYEILVTVSWPPSGRFTIKGIRTFYESQ